MNKEFEFIVVIVDVPLGSLKSGLCAGFGAKMQNESAVFQTEDAWPVLGVLYWD
jgi:hypothetical protein